MARGRSGLIVTLTIIGVLAGFGLVAGIWLDWAWADSLGFGGPFLRRLRTAVALFALGGVVAALCLGGFVRAAARASGRDTLGRWLGLAGGTVGGLSFGLIAAADVQPVLAALNAVPFGVAEPAFGRDAGFYVFTLPVLSGLVGWAMGLVVATLVAVWLVGQIAAQPSLGVVAAPRRPPA